MKRHHVKTSLMLFSFLMQIITFLLSAFAAEELFIADLQRYLKLLVHSLAHLCVDAQPFNAEQMCLHSFTSYNLPLMKLYPSLAHTLPYIYTENVSHMIGTRSILEVRCNHNGLDYALATQESFAAEALLYEHEGIKLDGTYSAKAFACLRDDLHNDQSHVSNVLFWNTFWAGDTSTQLEQQDYRTLPVIFHRYFQETVQEDDPD